MSDSNVIKEFLVALGFKTDESALKKFEQGISQATKAVLTLGTAVEATALAVGIGVARFASNLEALYFASVRTGASATNLKAFDRAARDMGASAGEAQASIEGLARFMRNNPGGEIAVGSWFGINTRDKAGKQLDPVQMALAIAKSMQAMPQWQALMLGGKAGLSENTILAMLNPAFVKNFETIGDRLKAAGFKEAAEHAHRFMVQLRTLGDVLVILGTRIEDALQQKLGISLKSITDWLSQNQNWIIDSVVHIAGVFIDQFNAIVAWLTAHGPEIKKMIKEALEQFDASWKIVKPALQWIWEKLVELDSATDGWSTKLIALGLLLKATGGTSIIGGVLSLAGAFVQLGAALSGLGTGAAAGGLGTLAKALGLLTRGGLVVGAGVGLGWGFDKLFPNNWLAQTGSALSEAVHDAADYAGAQGRAAEKRPQLNAVRTLMNMGLSNEAAAGLVANFQAESNLSPTAQNGSHYGIAQWDKSRQADFGKWAGFDMKDDRADLQKQMEFAVHELFYGKEQIAGDMLLAANNAARAGYVVSHYYERSGLGDQDNLRSAAAVNLSHQTIVNVDGSGEPAAVARHVANEQERVARASAAALVREFASVVQ
jgi:tail lysozyme